MRKVKLFLHPDKVSWGTTGMLCHIILFVLTLAKLPKGLTENQSLLFRTLWDVLTQAEKIAL